MLRKPIRAGAKKSPTVRELTHDLANALGGARLRVTLLRAESNGSPLDGKNLDALERLVNQACEIEETLHAAIRRAFPSSATGPAPRRRRARSTGAR